MLVELQTNYTTNVTVVFDSSDTRTHSVYNTAFPEDVKVQHFYGLNQCAPHFDHMPQMHTHTHTQLKSGHQHEAGSQRTTSLFSPQVLDPTADGRLLGLLRHSVQNLKHLRRVPEPSHAFMAILAPAFP